MNDQKKVSCNGLAAENVDKNYIFDAFISKHLSPFFMTTPAKVLMPGKKLDGQWKAISVTDRALMNASTAYVFKQIEEDANTPGSLMAYLHDSINIYGKLDKQNFSTKNWLVLSSASGANPCAETTRLSMLTKYDLYLQVQIFFSKKSK